MRGLVAAALLSVCAGSLAQNPIEIAPHNLTLNTQVVIMGKQLASWFDEVRLRGGTTPIRWFFGYGDQICNVVTDALVGYSLELTAEESESPDHYFRLDGGMDGPNGTWDIVIRNSYSVPPYDPVAPNTPRTVHWEFALWPGDFQGSIRDENHNEIATTCLIVSPLPDGSNDPIENPYNCTIGVGDPVYFVEDFINAGYPTTIEIYDLAGYHSGFVKPDHCEPTFPGSTVERCEWFIDGIPDGWHQVVIRSWQFYKTTCLIKDSLWY